MKKMFMMDLLLQMMVKFIQQQWITYQVKILLFYQENYHQCTMKHQNLMFHMKI